MKKLLFVALMTITVPAWAQTIEKNGTIYKQHPLIDATNAIGALYQKGDVEGMAKYYADTAKFYAPGSDKPLNLAQQKTEWQTEFATWDQIKLTVQGYPDGLDYTKEGFTVQTWFAFSAVSKKTKKAAKTNMVLFLNFNKDGKISGSVIYYDPTSLIAALQ